ncbi:hypothetical protein [Sulfidibacter corallicola]|uniref:Ig-like domain-containing protein n=1 Tax=Sulfidibacter corallicola TaxID=2818388 RepID=A0A8A4TIN3_SULCO|nr:hypothetical protein [Sulfidibacter corallicola]QTD48711.1 hypothetical protein J3U87_24280 [Sulfidibacter corallicola]
MVPAFAQPFELVVEPRSVVQGDQPMTLTAQAADSRELVSIQWMDSFTGEVLGDEATITLQPDFEMTTLLLVEAQDANDNLGQGIAVIEVENPNGPGLTLFVDPPYVLQGDEPMTFKAVVMPEDAEVSYEWVRDDTGAVVGNEAEVTLQPEFTECTTVTVTVSDGEGITLSSSAFIDIEGHNDMLEVMVEPPFVVQGDEPIVFEAVAQSDAAIESYKWVREDTGDVVGETARIELQPDFRFPTGISVEVKDAEGRTGYGFGFVEVMPPTDFIDVHIDPPMVVQGEEDMVFTAVVNHEKPIASYEWRRDDTGDVIGDGEQVTLAPEFERPTGISLLVRDEDGVEGMAFSTIFLEDPGGFIDVWIDPPFVVQSDETIRFTAVVNDRDEEELTYTWTNDLTGDVLGDEETLELDPNFTEPTPISLQVENESGDRGFAIAFIELEGNPNGNAPVFIDPPVQLQGEETMRFAAVTAPAIEVVSYTWEDLTNREVLGDGATLELAPEFEFDTIIGLTVVTSDDQTYTAEALILVDPEFPGELPVFVDPPVVLQGVDALSLTAVVFEETEIAEYRWINELTDETVGTERVLSFDEPLAETTPFRVEVRAEDGRSGESFALVLVYEGGHDPNGDGHNDMDDLLTQLPQWSIQAADVLDLLTIRTR